MSTSSFEITGELNDILGLFIIEWVELNYKEVKKIQQTKFETYPPYKDEFKEPCDIYRDLIQMLFVSYSYNEKCVEHIIKREIVQDSHKIMILQYIIHFYKKKYNVRYIDDVLDWKQFNNLSYLLYHLIRIYVKNTRVEETLFLILRFLEKETIINTSQMNYI